MNRQTKSCAYKCWQLTKSDLVSLYNTRTYFKCGQQHLIWIFVCFFKIICYILTQLLTSILYQDHTFHKFLTNCHAVFPCGHPFRLLLSCCSPTTLCSLHEITWWNSILVVLMSTHIIWRVELPKAWVYACTNCWRHKCTCVLHVDNLHIKRTNTRMSLSRNKLFPLECIHLV